MSCCTTPARFGTTLSKKVYSYLGRQAKRKHEKPDLTLVVAGCVAQQEGEALLRRVPELDLVMGPPTR